MWWKVSWFFLDFRYNFQNIFDIISKSFATYGCCHLCLKDKTRMITSHSIESFVKYMLNHREKKEKEKIPREREKENHWWSNGQNHNNLYKYINIYEINHLIQPPLCRSHNCTC